MELVKGSWCVQPGNEKMQKEFQRYIQIFEGLLSMYWEEDLPVLCVTKTDLRPVGTIYRKQDLDSK